MRTQQWIPKAVTIAVTMAMFAGVAEAQTPTGSFNTFGQGIVQPGAGLLPNSGGFNNGGFFNGGGFNGGGFNNGGFNNGAFGNSGGFSGGFNNGAFGNSGGFSGGFNNGAFGNGGGFNGGGFNGGGFNGGGFNGGGFNGGGFNGGGFNGGGFNNDFGGFGFGVNSGGGYFGPGYGYGGGSYTFPTPGFGAWNGGGAQMGGGGQTGRGIPILGLNTRPAMSRGMITGQAPRRSARSSQSGNDRISGRGSTSGTSSANMNRDEARLVRQVRHIMAERPLRSGEITKIGATGVSVRYRLGNSFEEDRFPIDQVYFFRDNGDLATVALSPGSVEVGDTVMIADPNAPVRQDVAGQRQEMRNAGDSAGTVINLPAAKARPSTSSKPARKVTTKRSNRRR